MAPKKKVILCQICNENQFKYKCSKCMVVYCSVPCYKKHKEESCTHLVPADLPPPPSSTSEPSSTTPSDPSPSITPSDPPAESIPTSSNEPEPPAEASSSSSSLPKATPPSIRALSTLLWPTESEDADMADGAGDPLEKYEPKPLRREELVAIAISPELRLLLANPLLPPLLNKINSIPPSSSHHHHHNPSPMSSRDAFLKAALGVVPPSSLQQQPVHSVNYRGRGGRGRGRGGRGGAANGRLRGREDGLGMTDEEMLAFRSFAACVEKVLKSVRDERRGLDWEDGLGL